MSNNTPPLQDLNRPMLEMAVVEQRKSTEIIKPYNVRSTLALSAFETHLIQVVLIACVLFFILRGMRATGVNQAQVPAPNRCFYVVAGVALAVVAFAVALLVGKNP